MQPRRGAEAIKEKRADRENRGRGRPDLRGTFRKRRSFIPPISALTEKKFPTEEKGALATLAAVSGRDRFLALLHQRQKQIPLGKTAAEQAVDPDHGQSLSRNAKKPAEGSRERLVER